VLSSEDEEFIESLRKLNGEKLELYGEVSVLAFITTRSDSPDVTDPVSHVAQSLLFIARFDGSKKI
jgi:hypothetical protein